MDVFLSYRRAEKQIAKKIKKQFERRGLTVWMDESHIEPGTQWAEEIRQAIQKASYFVPIFTKAFEPKSYMMQELDIALEDAKHRPASVQWVLPILYKIKTYPDLGQLQSELERLQATIANGTRQRELEPVLKAIKAQAGLPRNDPRYEEKTETTHRYWGCHEHPKRNLWTVDLVCRDAVGRRQWQLELRFRTKKGFFSDYVTQASSTLDITVYFAEESCVFSYVSDGALRFGEISFSGPSDTAMTRMWGCYLKFNDAVRLGQRTCPTHEFGLRHEENTSVV